MRVACIAAVARTRLQTVSVNCPLVDVAALLVQGERDVVVVCDAAGMPWGTITRTVLSTFLDGVQPDMFGTTAGAAMTQGYAACTAEDALAGVLAKMHEHGLAHVLLMDADGALLGVVQARDGLRALLAAGHPEAAQRRIHVLGSAQP